MNQMDQEVETLENNIKDLFTQEKYDKVIVLLEEQFKKLFIQMLDYKSEESDSDYNSLDYRKLAIMIPDYYPRYTQDIINLTHAEYREDNTYLDVINIMLSLYSYFQDTYKEAYEEDDDYEIEELT